MARSKLVIFFDAGAVCAAVVSRGLRGRALGPRARVELGPGALVPSAFDGNLTRGEEVRTALARLRQTLGGGLPPATLVLPDGIALLALLEPEGGAQPRDYARFRLGPTLPYPAAEAMIDALPVGAGRVLAAAVRRSVIEGYEAAAASAGFAQEAVDLMPLAALAGLLREPPSAGSCVQLILGDVAVSLAAFRDGTLRVFRSRRRVAGGEEAAWLAREAERTAASAGNGGPPALRVVGRGAPQMREALRALGRPAELGGGFASRSAVEDAAEVPWLAAVLP